MVQAVETGLLPRQQCSAPTDCELAVPAASFYVVYRAALRLRDCVGVDCAPDQQGALAPSLGMVNGGAHLAVIAAGVAMAADLYGM